MASLPAVWRFLGPTSITKPPFQSYPSPAHQSGRITALAVDPDCAPGGRCRLWVAAAGGGVWRTDDALAANPVWRHASDGITSNAIAAIALDPNDPTGNTLYAGTGEANVTSDAEAGVGLFKTTDGGASWSLVPGSVPMGMDRSIGAIAVAAGDPDTIWIGTSRGRHGRSGFTGRSDYTPPGAAPYGIYRSDDGGDSFETAFATPMGPGDPADRTDRAEGGVSSLAFAPGDPQTLYASVYGHGIYRMSEPIDGDTDWHQVLDVDRTSASARTEFDLVPVDADTMRIYAVVGDEGGIAMRNDAAGEPAATMLAGWQTVSSADPADPGFGGAKICNPQCSYDLVVRTDPGDPDVVWIGGVAQWNEIPPMSDTPATAGASFGRTVVRSTDGGSTWDDMTVGAQDPATDVGGSIGPVRMNGSHPDLHALVLLPSDTGSAFVAGDGGVVRTSAGTVDATDTCPSTLDGAYAARCQEWKTGVPAHVYDLNAGLATLQFQRLAAAPDGSGALLGGTQDNGSMAYGGDPTWTGFAQGDGGGQGFDAVDPNVRWRSYYQASTTINLDFAADPLGGWRDAFAGLGAPDGSCAEVCAFYSPWLTDPRVGSRAYFGQQHVFRTDDRGSQWNPTGEALAAGDDYLSALARPVADTGTSWAATATGRVWIARNADAPDPADVDWLEIGAAPLPRRYPSAIAVDPEDPLHAFIAFSGYEAYTPASPATSSRHGSTRARGPRRSPTSRRTSATCRCSTSPTTPWPATCGWRRTSASRAARSGRPAGRTRPRACRWWPCTGSRWIRWAAPSTRRPTAAASSRWTCPGRPRPARADRPGRDAARPAARRHAEPRARRGGAAGDGPADRRADRAGRGRALATDVALGSGPCAAAAVLGGGARARRAARQARRAPARAAGLSAHVRRRRRPAGRRDAARGPARPRARAQPPPRDGMAARDGALGRERQAGPPRPRDAARAALTLRAHPRRTATVRSTSAAIDQPAGGPPGPRSRRSTTAVGPGRPRPPGRPSRASWKSTWPPGATRSCQSSQSRWTPASAWSPSMKSRSIGPALQRGATSWLKATCQTTRGPSWRAARATTRRLARSVAPQPLGSADA